MDGGVDYKVEGCVCVGMWMSLLVVEVCVCCCKVRWSRNGVWVELSGGN